MALVCSICNEVPQEPVLSPASNHVFERRLIVQFIEENGTDPINGESLSADQLMDIKADPLVKPRPPSATSIPAVLKLLQDEWDACMLHSFTLRQQLQTARQELSHALYQHDAACRVIARLTRELNTAREALANMKPQAAAAYQQQQQNAGEDDSVPPSDAPADTERPTEMTDDILQTLQDTAAMLTAERKKRGKKLPEGLFSPENISNFKQTAIHPGLHSASVPGILALDLSADGSCVLTGGADKNAVVFHKDTEQVVATLKGHSKKVTDVLYHPRADVAITASPDTTVRIWSVTNSSCAQTIRSHSGPVTGISLHPTGDYLLTCSLDEHWAFSDVNTGAVLSSGRDDSSGLTCAQFHPDGLIFCTGTTDSVVKIWDLKERSNVANFPGHSGNITSVSFSENGYYLATAGEDSLVKLWDLRKLKNFKTLTMENKSNVKALTFDMSGTYLAMAGNGGIQVYMSKQWDQLASLNDHTSTVTGVRFGYNASFLVSCSMDRTLRFFGL